jgi:hypothetical protein
MSTGVASDDVPDILWDFINDRRSCDNPYDPNITKKERRRRQNRLNQRKHRKKLKLVTPCKN